MFLADHLVILAINIVLIAVSTVLSVRYRLSSRKASVLFAALCLISEIVKDLANMVPSEHGGYVLDQDDIPLHLCSIVVFVMLFMVFSKNEKNREKIKSAVTVIGLIAPVFAMLIPTEGTAFDKVITYQYFLYHSALMWYALHNVLTAEVDLGKRAYVRNIGYVTVFTLLSLYINSALSVYGTNFSFLRKPPVDGLPILNLDHGWYFYFAILMLIAYGSVTLVHTPFMIAEKKKSKQARS